MERMTPCQEEKMRALVGESRRLAGEETQYLQVGRSMEVRSLTQR